MKDLFCSSYDYTKTVVKSRRNPSFGGHGSVSGIGTSDGGQSRSCPLPTVPFPGSRPRPTDRVPGWVTGSGEWHHYLDMSPTAERHMNWHYPDSSIALV